MCMTACTAHAALNYCKIRGSVMGGAKKGRPYWSSATLLRCYWLTVLSRHWSLETAPQFTFDFD